MEEFLHQYGYLALSIGTFFEGETAILIASSLAASGVFSVPLTVFFGFLGSFISDWLYFGIGRLNGKYFLSRRPKLEEKFRPVHEFFRTHRLQILFSYRFLYGFRVIIPLMLGMSDIPVATFFIYSILAGLIWAGTVGIFGFTIGTLLELRTEFFENHIQYIMIGFVCFGLALGFFVKRLVGKKMHVGN